MDLSQAAWRKSSYSGGNGGQCVEVATIPGHPAQTDRICAVRDSTKPGGPALAFGPEPWQQFTAKIKAGKTGLS
ncbi:MAG: DUF397 domain-containing protein [Streptosporangiaceae bacterium]